MSIQKTHGDKGSFAAKQERFNQILWSARHIFPNNIKREVYGKLLLVIAFLKFMSDLTQNKASLTPKLDDKNNASIEACEEQLKISQKHSFYKLWQSRHKTGIGKRINQTLQAIEEANAKYLKSGKFSVFQNIDFDNKQLGNQQQRNTVLCNLLDYFNQSELALDISLQEQITINSNGFKFLIEKLATSKNDTQQSQTPTAISNLIATLLAPQPGDCIYDPVCGSATLLIQCGRKIFEHYKTSHYRLYGQELNHDMWAVAQMNLLVHGETDQRVVQGDVIVEPGLLDSKGQLMRFDVVVANPPFNSDNWSYLHAANDPFLRFARGIPPKSKGNYAFILHMIESLKSDTGRMAVTVPHGVLFRGGSEQEIRAKLIEENLLDAVIGLPEKIFTNANVSVALLIFRKNKIDNKILFIDTNKPRKAAKNSTKLSAKEAEGVSTVYYQYSQASSRLVVKEAPIKPHITQNIHEKIYTNEKRISLVKQHAYVASLDEVRNNNYNLNISHYIDNSNNQPAAEWDKLFQERKELKVQLGDLENEIEKHLKDLGYQG
ncbi:N-6 DNA methylase [Aliikangiella sp. IMCC44359]|uniref:N-6 DNA methylase n=1 Tax=Aliikangiella sp. IMCC44359 TaxID=3459125 RepID=UPI00403AFC90